MMLRERSEIGLDTDELFIVIWRDFPPELSAFCKKLFNFSCIDVGYR